MRCAYPRHTGTDVSKMVLTLAITTFLVLGFSGTVSAQEAAKSSVQPARPLHIVPMVNRNGQPVQPAATAHLDYYGGPVISNVNVISVFWTGAVDSSVQTTLPQFFSAITNSTYFDMLTEYATNITPAGGGTGTNQSIGRGATGGTYTITPSVCANGLPCVVDDTQIQSELLAQIKNGFLPLPTLDSNGHVDSLYMVFFPPNVTITQQGSESCVVFCAYHGTTTSTFNSKNLAYGVFPDMSPTSACFGGCGSNADYIKDTTSVASHELVEATTDTDVGLATTYAPPLAWYDQTNGEIGDICNAQQATVTAGGQSWVVQKQWLNSVNACAAVGKHPVFKMTAPATATSGTPISVTITVQNPVSGGTMASFIGTAHFTSSDAAAVLPVDYKFTSTDKGVHTFSITLKTSGSQTITAKDTVDSAITAVSTVTVGGGGTTGPLTVTPTSLAFPNTHAGVTNPTTKLVTVKNSNTLAIGITTVAFTGTNPGDFTISSNTCGTSLAAGASCLIKVAFAPKAVGARSASLTLTDKATNSPQSVTLTGTGTAAVTLTPTTFTYATTTVGVKTAAHVFTFKNLLTTAVNVTGVSIKGTNPGDFAVASKTCTGSIAAMGTCTVSVTFTPKATGARSGSLQVTSNALPSPVSSVLKGTGK